LHAARFGSVLDILFDQENRMNERRTFLQYLGVLAATTLPTMLFISPAEASVRIAHSGFETITILKDGKRVFEFGKNVILSAYYDRNFIFFRDGFFKSVNDFPYRPPPYTSASDIERELGFQWRMLALLESKRMSQRDRLYKAVMDSLLQGTETYAQFKRGAFLGQFQPKPFYDQIVRQREAFVVMPNRV
jgi:hypothetical protein